MTEPPGRPGDREQPPPYAEPYGGGPWAGEPGTPPERPYGPELTHPRFEYGGRWRRLLAAIIDALIVYAVTWLVTAPIAGFGSMYERPSGRQIVADLITLILAFAYFVVQHGRWGQTLGKRAMSLRVVRAGDGGPITYGQAAWRLLFQYLISAVTCGVGGLVDVAWILWDERRQALHDKVAKTVVVAVEPGGPDPYAAR